MDACTIDEDFRRATKDARSNWAQVARSLENLKKSAKSNAKVQAQVTDKFYFFFSYFIFH